MSAETLGELVKRLRGRAKLSQEELAARVGLSHRTVSNIERGVQLHPRLVTLELLGDALGIGDDERLELRMAASASEVRSVPRLTNPVFGRNRVIDELCEIFRNAESAFITVTGAPGVGKTVLARSVAASLSSDFAGAVAFVPLEDVRNAADLPMAVAAALGMLEHRPVEALYPELIDRMKLCPLMLVLDNIEHLVSAGPMVAEFARAVPTLSILATGTRPFNLSVEREMMLPPLNLDDAAQLFEQRASALLRSYEPNDEDRKAIERICAALEGLPLAIELAAMRTRSLTASQIADRLWELLSQGPRDYPARHQALDAAIGWSCSLLDPNERVAFARFSVFSGGASLEAAEKAAGISARQVDDLVRQNLLIAEGAGPNRRLRMLSPIREFAAARLHESENETQLRERHALYYVEFAKSLNPRTRHTMKQVLARFDAERQNFGRAWEWIRAHDRWDLGSSLITSLAPLFELRHAFEVWQGWLVEAAEHANAFEPLARWAILWKAAAPFAVVYDEIRAERFARQALEVAEALGDLGRVSVSLERLAGLRFDIGDIPGALELFERAREHAHEGRQFLPLFGFYNNVGLARAMAGEYERALAEYTRSLQEARAVTNDLVQAGIVHNIAEVLLEMGDIAGADSQLRGAIELADELDYWEVSAVSQLLAARIALAQNDAEMARKSLAVALEYFAGTAQPIQAADTLKEIAYYLSRTNRGRESLMVLAFLRKQYRPQRELPTLRDRHGAAEAGVRAGMPPSEIDDCRRTGEELNLDAVLAMLLGAHSQTLP